MSADRICTREDELLDALGRGFVGAELESHVKACSDCAELRLTVQALLDDRGGLVAASEPPSAGTTWWRMQLRTKREAEQRVRRSLVIGEGVTLFIALSLFVIFFGGIVIVGAKDLVGALRLSTPLLLVIAAWFVVMPIAGWLAVRQK